MNTKSIIWIVIAVIIIIGIAVWLSKTPASPAVPTTPPVTSVTTQPTDTTAPAVTTTPTTTPTTSTTPLTTTKTKDGMTIQVTKAGSGPSIANGQTAEMLYTGTLADGTVFDSTASRNNAPFSFTLGAGQVIPGWDEGILGMKVGEQRTLIIPAALAYGAAGNPPVIPQNATLTFKVTLVGIK